ncbi:hypothetical protein PVAP13_7KG107300 [Panicum virgatum]|uniref:non-specific serine/threonine protein kinase n=1 Tax=Panicum virgatum TaxID=38727 RepID=A0A8T0QF28_PANVG|nr:hypothetical protein PVAP13_7KG107300 [Panicum virgatum]
MVLFDSEGYAVWKTVNTTTAGGDDGSVAVLLDSGNFVLQLVNGTVVAGRLVAWKGPDDPSSGDFSLTIDPSSDLQFFVWNGSLPYTRSHVANEVSVYGGTYPSNTTSILSEYFYYSGDESYYTYTVSDGPPYTRLLLEYRGNLSLLSWNNTTLTWTVASETPSYCDLYASCGPFGYCDTAAVPTTCRCPDGFELVDSLNLSRGCRRKEALRCGKDNNFMTMPNMKAPDKFLHIRNTSFDQCAAECSKNCSCMAYAYANLKNAGTMGDTSRCLVWTGDLMDMEKGSFTENLYIRLGESPAQKNGELLKILLPIVACLLILGFAALVWKCKRRGTKKIALVLKYLRSTDEAGNKNIEFPFVSFNDIVAATDNFSDTNMLGKGGFGKVYKGMLAGTTEVAIKRLSKGSGQGTEEFRNEVVLIAKLQHKNLVKLLGCCIHEDEKMLVYEYLPNKSLDYFLFDSARKSMVQRPTRFKIIQGDSRLTIIHRDLKASNILLDKEMSPKISDFGMARIFCGDQHQATTNRVVGTYGYMSPEYAMEGAFSVKSDTYSFGVLLLEIVSGLKISSPHLIMDFPNLIVYAWNLWKDGKTEDLVDPSVKENCPFDEVSRCIHIGLLCAQDSPNCRPLMSTVVLMLESKSTPLPTPLQPVYFGRRDAEPGRGSDNRIPSMNDMSLTVVEGR